METERAVLVRQALAGIAALDTLVISAPEGAARAVSGTLARLSAAEREAVAASLAILLAGMRRLGQPTDDEPA